MSRVNAETVPPKSDKKTLRPFRDIKINPSWLAVSKLNNTTLTFTPPPQRPPHPHAPKPKPSTPIEAHISALEIPVTYSAVMSTIPPLHASKQYDVMLHVGLSAKSDGLKIERQAHKMGYNEVDADGKLCDRVEDKGHAKRGFGKGFEIFGDKLKTGVDVDSVVQHLRDLGLKATNPSDDPGRYLCDYIYYCSLACAQKEGNGVKVLFMHVPPEGVPYSVEDMTKAVKGVIEYYALHT